MKMTRRLLAVVLIALLGLTACAQESTPEATDEPTEIPAVETIEEMDEATAEMTEPADPTPTPGTMATLEEEVTEDAVDLQPTPGSDEDDMEITVEPVDPTAEATDEATEEATDEATEEATDDM